MLAVIKQIMLPETNALTATDVMSGLFSGHIALNEPIIIPNELGFANPQIANVAMAALRSYKKKIEKIFFFGYNDLCSNVLVDRID